MLRAGVDFILPAHYTFRMISNGKFYPLGAALKADGVNFAVYSQHAKSLFLLLFDNTEGPPTDIIQLQAHTRDIWHVFVQGLKAGQLYAFKADGEYNPKLGFRFNKHKLLIDPYAKALTGKLVNKDNLLLGYNPLSAQKDLSPDIRDNSACVPKCVVVDDHDFDWQGDSHPDLPPNQTIIYELHVKGFTAHPSAKVRNSGTYLGLIEKIPYLKDLGVTAVELLPVHEHYNDDFLLKRGLTNYWGYNTLSYFSPEISYGTQASPGCQVNEFKKMVRELHKAGIEVILDVVFNHTGEGNELGLTVCYRGLDNHNYYCLTGPAQEPGRYYQDYSGCGNSFNVASRPGLRLVLDSLRYWVEQMHVDGFRFDLASVLGRGEKGFQNTAVFFEAVSQDPALSRVKLIAEPWDIQTYQVGNFPVDWCEWNGRYRDVVRKFVKGDTGQIGEIGTRITGSGDIFAASRRGMFNSVNFITCHDGFTLWDLVSYNDKHNQRNGENNRDGENNNNSWNCGIAGETNDPGILALRKKQIKNFAFYLLMSGGTPMLLGGDEFCRTQGGNNNAYCQDNEISWVNWGLLEKNRDIHRYFRKLVRLVLYLRSARLNSIKYGNLIPPRIIWYGDNLNDPDWNNPLTRCVSLWFPSSETGTLGEEIFIIFNADFQKKWVKIRPPGNGRKWRRMLDTALDSPDDIADLDAGIIIDPQDVYIVNARSVIGLILPSGSRNQ